MRAKHKIKERVTQKKGRYYNERSIRVEFNEKSSLSSSSVVRKIIRKILTALQTSVTPWIRNLLLTN